MTFSQLTNQLAENHGLTKAKAKAIAKDLFGIINEELTQNGSVRVTDFGTFSVVRTNERKLNAAVGGGISPAHNRPRFKASKTLKQAIN